jgi:hypothetical protein
MEVYRLEVDYDASGDSPWGEVRSLGEHQELWPLSRIHPLASDWQPMEVTLAEAEERADFVRFSGGGWAVRPEALRVLEPLLTGAAEFLPLMCDTGDEFFALHPLELVDLGPDAEASRNRVSGNITWVHRFSFDPKNLVGKKCFRIRHPKGSAAGPTSGGSDVLVSDAIYKHILGFGFRGIRFVQAFPLDERWAHRHDDHT